jgi:hypothetical protein
VKRGFGEKPGGVAKKVDEGDKYGESRVGKWRPKEMLVPFSGMSPMATAGVGEMFCASSWSLSMGTSCWAKSLRKGGGE